MVEVDAVRTSADFVVEEASAELGGSKGPANQPVVVGELVDRLREAWELTNSANVASLDEE